MSTHINPGLVPNLFTWLPLPHLPKVPDHFINMAMDIVAPTIQKNQEVVENEEDYLVDIGFRTKEYKYRKIIKDGKEYSTRAQEGFLMGEEWEQWVKENLTPNYVETSIRLSGGTAEIHGPHVDYPGKIRLFYLLSRGGENAETVWYVKPGEPAVYDIDKEQRANPIHEDNIDNLIEIDRAKFPLESWVLFNGYIMHGVHGLTGPDPRLNFSVTLKPDMVTFDVRPVLS